MKAEGLIAANMQAVIVVSTLAASPIVRDAQGANIGRELRPYKTRRRIAAHEGGTIATAGMRDTDHTRRSAD